MRAVINSPQSQCPRGLAGRCRLYHSGVGGGAENRRQRGGNVLALDAAGRKNYSFAIVKCYARPIWSGVFIFEFDMRVIWRCAQMRSRSALASGCTGIADSRRRCFATAQAWVSPPVCPPVSRNGRQFLCAVSGDTSANPHLGEVPGFDSRSGN